MSIKMVLRRIRTYVFLQIRRLSDESLAVAGKVEEHGLKLPDSWQHILRQLRTVEGLLTVWIYLKKVVVHKLNLGCKPHTESLIKSVYSTFN